MSCLHGQMFERLSLIIWHFLNYFLLVLIWWIGLNFKKDIECLASITLNFNNIWHLFANNFEFHKKLHHP